MGRPIKSKFIKSTNPKYITCTAWPVGASSAVACTIVNQQSSNSYKVTDGTHTSRCKLVNSASPTVGQMSISVQEEVNPTQNAVGTITMKALTATVVSGGTGYATGTITLTNGVVLTIATESGGVVQTVTVTTPGSLSTIATNPVAQTSTTAGGTGATFNLTYGVNTFTIAGGSGGTGYGAHTTVQFVGGGSSVTPATASVTSTSGVLTTSGVTTAGSGYTSVPTVIFVSQGAIEYVNKLNNRTVNTFSDHRYIWEFPTSGHLDSNLVGDLNYAVIQSNLGT